MLDFRRATDNYRREYLLIWISTKKGNKLIESVRFKAILYNVRTSNYRNIDKEELAPDKVAEEVEQYGSNNNSPKRKMVYYRKHRQSYRHVDPRRQRPQVTQGYAIPDGQ